MRALLQRVSRGRVSVSGTAIAEIGAGLVILLGVGPHDGEEQARYLAEKIANLRIFEDDEGKMNRSLLEAGGQAILVSQFTLYADTRKGRRPSFTDAAPPEIARPLVERFAALLRRPGRTHPDRRVRRTHARGYRQRRAGDHLPRALD